MEIKQFLEELSSGSPTPGGGSASALAGALAASLIAMVARLSDRGEKPVRREMREIEKKAVRFREQLHRAMGEDIEAFDEVMAAFRLPKETETQRLVRRKKIEKAYRGATRPPQKVCEASLALLELTKILLRKGNPNAFSDAGVAVFLSCAATEGGLLNIQINLASISDRVFTKGKQKAVADLRRRLAKRMAEIRKEFF